MKTKLYFALRTTRCALAVALLSTLNLQLSTFAQGTAFTYQGRLQNNGSPASGTYNLTFSLFNTNTSGVSIAGPVTNNAVVVTNGLFTVLIDFGPGAFTGQTNWLEIAVETNGVNTFTTLTPRQQLTPTPYAIYAESASGLSGTLSASQLTSVGNDNGDGNFFVGPSGNSTTSGSDNTAIGDYALFLNWDGYNNTANGYNALYSNAGGSYNTGIGKSALLFNTSGSANTAIGAEALYNNTIGYGNTAIGIDTLVYNTSGSYNIALGFTAGLYIATGSSNIDIGNQGFSTDTNIIRIGSGQTQTFIAGVITGDGSGLTNLNVSAAQLTSIGNTNGGGGNFFVGPSGNSATSGSENTANGNNALYYNTSGSFNTANGVYALYRNASGSYNTANGFEALDHNTHGSYNIALGYQAGWNITTGSSNIDIGNQGFSTDTNIIRIGSVQSQTFIAGVITGNGGGLTNLSVPAASLTGTIPLAQLPAAVVTNGASGVNISGNISGNGGGLLNLNASQLTSIGNTNGGGGNFFVGPSGNSTMTGGDNTANGAAALLNNTSGYFNTANGAAALTFNISGWYNTAIGYQALEFNTNGANNTAIGVNALYYNTSGSYNTANGYQALNNNMIGSGNTANGVYALCLNTSGCFNTAIGDSALYFNSGSNNIALGYRAGYNITTGSSNIDIGNQAFSTDTNIIRIGGGQSQTFIAGVITGNGGGLTNLSVSAASLTGTIPLAQLPAAVVTNGASGVNISGNISGNGGGLTNLNGAQLTGVITGNGAGLTNLSVSAASLTGTIPLAQLPATVITNGASGVNISGNISGNGAGLTGVPGAITWQTASGTVQAQSNNGYIATDASQVTVTLPTSPNVGDTVRVSGPAAGGWKIAQNSGQSVLLCGAVNIRNWMPYGLVSAWYTVASSSDGTKLVACVYNGQIYTSTNSGVTWTAQTSGSQQWSGVASSADGTKLVACTSVSAGLIYTSTDSGATWTARTSGHSWGGVASSSDGTKLVAWCGQGQIYTSSDSGATWTARASSQNWYGVASSSDGTKLVACVNGGQIYTSSDSGVTWVTQASSQNWRGVASSSDGTKLVAWVYGGQIYTYQQSTTVGATGYVTGEQGAAIELQYVGNNQFLPLSYVGTILGY